MAAHTAASHHSTPSMLVLVVQSRSGANSLRNASGSLEPPTKSWHCSESPVVIVASKSAITMMSFRIARPWRHACAPSGTGRRTHSVLSRLPLKYYVSCQRGTGGHDGQFNILHHWNRPDVDRRAALPALSTAQHCTRQAMSFLIYLLVRTPMCPPVSAPSLWATQSARRGQTWA